MSRPVVVLSAYPLSEQFRAGLADAVASEPELLTIAGLRRLPPRGLASTLLGLRGARVLLPVEDPSSEVIVPILQGVAMLTLPSTIEVVDAGFSVTRIRRRDAARNVAAVLGASMDGKRAARRARRELERLAVEPRLELHGVRADRLLYLNPNLWFGVKAGGSVGHVAGVINGLLDAGVEVELRSATPPVLVRPEASFRALEPPHAFGLPLELNYYRFQHRIVDQLRDERADALYQRLSVGSYAGVVLSRLLRVPFVLEYNGSEVWISRHWGRALRYEALARLAEEAALRHAHVVVTVSTALRDDLLERGVDAERIVTYPNCVDADFYDAGRFDEAARADLRRSYGIPPDALVATFVGTFGHWHGVEVLARAIRRLLDEAPDWVERNRLHFMLVGDGLRMPEVRETLGRLAPARVTLTGLVPQADGPLHLAASDILLSPHVRNADGSPFFGSPTKLFEYMAMGKPIVASDLDQIGEVLRPAVDASALPAGDAEPGDRLAVLCEPGSPDEIGSAIRFLAERPEWRERLGRNARRAVEARYTWRHHVGAVLGRLDDVVGGGATGGKPPDRR